MFLKPSPDPAARDRLGLMVHPYFSVFSNLWLTRQYFYYCRKRHTIWKRNRKLHLHSISIWPWEHFFPWSNNLKNITTFHFRIEMQIYLPDQCYKAENGQRTCNISRATTTTVQTHQTGTSICVQHLWMLMNHQLTAIFHFPRRKPRSMVTVGWRRPWICRLYRCKGEHRSAQNHWEIGRLIFLLQLSSIL